MGCLIGCLLLFARQWSQACALGGRISGIERALAGLQRKSWVRDLRRAALVKSEVKPNGISEYTSRKWEGSNRSTCLTCVTSAPATKINQTCIALAATMSELDQWAAKESRQTAARFAPRENNGAPIDSAQDKCGQNTWQLTKLAKRVQQWQSDDKWKKRWRISA